MSVVGAIQYTGIGDNTAYLSLSFHMRIYLLNCLVIGGSKLDRGSLDLFIPEKFIRRRSSVDSVIYSFFLE
jgi:hypothetical protein